MKREWFVVALIVLVLVVVILLSPDSFVNLSPDGRSIFSQRGSSAVGVGECVDSDGGINYNVRGRTQGTNGNFADSCSGSELTEYFCSPAGNVRSRNYDCSIDGGSCVLGECLGNGFLEFFELAKIIPSDSMSFDRFGTSVSISGLTVIGGAPYHDDSGSNSGSAYVFEYNSKKKWEETQELLALNGAVDDRFGFAVAMDGDLSVIGANGDDDMGTDAGAAYVFRKNVAGVWEEEQKLTGSNTNSGDEFGRAVDVSGNIVVVGAYYYDGASPFGEVIVFKYSAGSGQWVEEQIIKAADIPPSGAAANFFGTSVAVDGNVLVIGNYLGGGTGNAHVFRYNGASWVYEQTLTASDAGSGDLLGWDVDIDGERIIAGAPSWDGLGGLGAPQAGAAYVFRYNLGNWVEEGRLTASNMDTGDWLGASVSISGNVVVAGAYLSNGPDDIGGHYINSGRSYVYQFDSLRNEWVETQILEASDGYHQDEFGNSVSIDGNNFVVGAHKEEAAFGSDFGTAYIFSTQ